MFNSIERIALKLISVVVLLSCVLLSFYIHIFGKTTPGGGFQAGAILASGIIIYQFLDDSAKIINQKILTILIAFGSILFIATGIASLAFGGELFQYSAFHGIYGHIIGAFLVETGVFLVVACGLVKIAHAIWNF